MLKLTELLNEINLKNILGDEITDDEKGRHSAVYEYKPDPTKIVKINKKQNKKLSKQVINDLILMNNNSDIAAKVFEITPYYAIIEKLNNSKVNKDLYTFRKEITNEDDFFVFESIKMYIIENKINKITSQIKSKDILNIANKYISLIKKAIQAFGEDVDIHAGNMGYDRQGNIKLLDI
jgi:predicted RND superfamily exporter protein